MVNRGVPSTACGRCRQKRLRCDRKPAGCGNCARAGQTCVGYRTALDLKFCDQTEAAAEMVRNRIYLHHAKEQNKRQTTSMWESSNPPEAAATSSVWTGHSVTLFQPTLGQYSSAHIRQSPTQVRDLICWFFTRYDSESAFDIAQKIWVEPYWPMAMDNTAFFQSLSLLSLDRKRQLTGTAPTDLYLAEKVELLKQIRSDLGVKGTAVDHQTILAMCGLAYYEILNGRVDAGKAHIHGIESTHAFCFLNKAEWLFVAWVDLRFALHSGKAPRLRYHVPPVVTDDEFQKLRDPIAYAMASQFTSLCPNSEALEMGFTSLFDVFVKLYELVLALPAIERTSDPPFRQLYDIEYKLRMLYGNLKPRLEDATDLQAQCALIIFLALQLQFWNISCLWLPIRAPAIKLISGSAYALLKAMPSATLAWEMQADIASLIWALTTLVMCAGKSPHCLPVCAILADALSAADIRTYAQFCNEATQWPLNPLKRDQWLKLAWKSAQKCREKLLLGSEHEDLLAPDVGNDIKDIKPVLLGPMEFVEW